MKWILEPCPELDPSYKKNAIARQAQLTKPLGSLGSLEEIAIQLAYIQQREQPSVDQVAITIFAGDHGIACEGISAFPQEVTTQMVMNFLQGGAAISVMAKQLNANMEVVDTGMVSPLNKQKGLISQRAGNGTANMATEAAMTQEQLKKSLQAGYDAIERATDNNTSLFIGGEMGIANTTSATVLFCAFLGLDPDKTTGAGTGLDNKGIKHKINIIKKVLSIHISECGDSTLGWMRCAGGFEIVALTGAYIHAAQSGIPILVDGFISSVAALCAVRINPSIQDYLFFSHLSAEQGHSSVLNILNHKPLLNLGMRLGEGSGAAVAATLLQSACALHNNMATFEEAAVSTKNKE